MWEAEKYVQLLSSQLQGFVKKGDGIFNFKCPKCGDSKKHGKKRGYLLRNKDSYIFYCHNCNAKSGFASFLRELNYSLYEEYLFETFKHKTSKPITPQKSKIELTPKRNNIFYGLGNIEAFIDASKFLDDRFISFPLRNERELYFCREFQHWTNKHIPGKFSNPFPDPRIVIPLRDTRKNVFGFQGRSIKSNVDQRYITIKFDEEHYKLYGCEYCNFNRRYYVTEGPFDSMFLDNAIASCGGKIQEEIKKLNYVPENSVVIYDNQPRNKQVVENLFDAIESNYSVVIWPKNIEEKDINDMIIRYCGNNISAVNSAMSYIQHIVETNTFQGLEAHLKFVEWRKI